MNGIRNIIKKELDRVFSDKKLVVSLFILPAFLMVGIYALIGFMQTKSEVDINEHQSLITIINCPKGFDEFISSSGFKGKVNYVNLDEIEEQKDSVLKGDIDLIVSFEEGFLDKILDYNEGDQVPEAKTFYNPSESYSSAARSEFVDVVLHTYQQQLLAKRIGNLSNILVFEVDVDPETSVLMNKDKANGKMLGMLLPYLITIMLFSGAMSLGVDAITGEKERGTLASMLITPLKRTEIVMGKLISICILASMSAAVYAISMIISMPMILSGMIPSEDGIKVNFTVIQMIQLLLIMLALVFLYVSIVSIVAVFSKTAKEANTYVMPVYILVMVSGMLTLFQSGNVPSDLFYAIPVYGSAISIQGVLLGELTLAQLALTLGSTIGLGCIISIIITKAFNSEKVMFNA